MQRQVPAQPATFPLNDSVPTLACAHAQGRALACLSCCQREPAREPAYALHASPSLRPPPALTIPPCTAPAGFCYINDIVLAILELLKVHQR